MRNKFSSIILKGCLMAALFLLYSCSQDKQSNERFKRISKGLKKQNELKRLSESQIISAAYDQGNKIAEASQASLVSTLKKALEKGGIDHAISFCNVKALPVTDSLSQAYGARIKRTALKIRNPKNQPDELEKQLLEAYQYTWEQGEEIKPNIQDLENGYVLYTKPILLNNALCLNCHGEIGQTVTADTENKLKTLYPDDQATGYKKGDFRGMWSILLSKKKIIQSIPTED